MLYSVTKIDLQTNKKEVRTTNRIAIATAFLGLFAEEVGELVEFGEPDEDGCRWVASESHLIEIKVILRNDGDPKK